MSQALAHRVADACVSLLNKEVTKAQIEYATGEFHKTKAMFAFVREEESSSSQLWKPGQKKGATALFTVNNPGIHKGVGQFDETAAYLKQFQCMESEFPMLAKLALDPTRYLSGFTEGELRLLGTPALRKLCYSYMYGKMETNRRTLAVFARLARIRNAVYVALVVKWVLAQNPHLTFLAAACDSITFKGFKDHAEFRRLSTTLSSVNVSVGGLARGVLEFCDETGSERTLSVHWKCEQPHQSAGAGLAVGVFSHKCNLYVLFNPEDQNPQTNAKVVPEHMFSGNLSCATNFTTVRRLGKDGVPLVDDLGNALYTENKLDSALLFSRVVKAALLDDPVQAHKGLVRVLKEFFPRRRKNLYMSVTKNGKPEKKIPEACRLLMHATKTSSASANSNSSSNGRFHRRDPAIAQQIKVGGYVVQQWYSDGAKKYMVVADLRECLKGCFHPVFAGKGICARACGDWDVATPLKSKWLIDMANALRMFWSDQKADVEVSWNASTTMRVDPKKKYASHVVFKCTRRVDGAECVFASVEDVLLVFKNPRYLGSVFDVELHTPLGRSLGSGPWRFEDVFDIHVYRTGGSLRSVGSRSSGEDGLLGAHVPQHVADKMASALPGEPMTKYWTPSERDFSAWSTVVDANREGAHLSVYGEPRTITPTVAAGGVLLTSELVGLRVLEEYIKMFYPGWTCRHVAGVQYYPATSFPCRPTVITRWHFSPANQQGENLDFYELFRKIVLPRLTTILNGRLPKSVDSARSVAAKIPCHQNNSFTTLYYDPERRVFSEARGDTKWEPKEQGAKRKRANGENKIYYRRKTGVTDGAVDLLGLDLEILLGELPTDAQSGLRTSLDAARRAETQYRVDVDCITLHKTDKKRRKVNVYDVRDAFIYRRLLTHENEQEGKKKRKTNKPGKLLPAQVEMLSENGRRTLAITVCFLALYDKQLAVGTIQREISLYAKFPLSPNSRAVLTYLKQKLKDVEKSPQQQCPLVFAPALFVAKQN